VDNKEKKGRKKEKKRVRKRNGDQKAVSNGNCSYASSYFIGVLGTGHRKKAKKDTK